MKKVSILLLMLVAVTATVQARTLAEIFTVKEGAVAGVFPYLDYNARMDMVEYVKAGSESPTREGMYNTEVRITELTDSALRIHADDLDIDVTLMTAGRDTVITVVRTLPLGKGDSDVAVYDTSWRAVAKSFEAPEYSDWLVRDATKTVDIEAIKAAVPYVTYTVTADPVAATLTLTNTVVNTPGLDKKIAALFKPQMTYELGGKKFKEQK